MTAIAGLLIAGGVVIGAALAVLTTIAAAADILPARSRAADHLRGGRAAPATAQKRIPTRIGMKSQ